MFDAGRTRRWLIAAGVGCVIGAAACVGWFGIYDHETTWALPPEGSISDTLGIRALTAELGDDVPTGRSIVTGHVESAQRRAYLPAISASRFRGVTFKPVSGNGKVSGHASATATIIYGDKGLAPGIRDVLCFETTHWLGAGFLNAHDDLPPGLASPVRLFTCSWISDDDRFAQDVLARVDQVIDQQGIVVVAGVNNGQGSSLPPVLAGGWNVIAVGNDDGDSSTGPTGSPQPGRAKPDLVAPGGLTSFATPAVASLVARLMETADVQGIERIIQPLAIKAILMASAEKPQGWRQPMHRPLDDRFGAGVPRMDTSYHMLNHRLEAQSLPSPAGWDYREITPGQTMSYRLLVAEPLKEFSVVLTWHRRVESRLVPSSRSTGLERQFTSRLADLDVVVLRSDTQQFVELAASRSRIDNVEHVYLTDLPPGRYDILVTRRDDLPESWDYALAWRLDAAPPSP